MNLPPWHAGDATTVIPLFGGTLAYIVFDYAFNPTVFAKWFPGPQAKARSVLLSRIVGGVWLGGFAVIAGRLLHVDLGVIPDDIVTALAFGLGTGVVLSPILFFQMHRPGSTDEYPQAKGWDWTLGRQAANAGAWLVYLLGYELFFRGLLFGALNPLWGPWPAIAAIAGLYCASHLGKSAGELFGTLPMGVWFALGAYSSGTFFAAFLAHSLIAILSDTFAIRAANRRSSA